MCKDAWGLATTMQISPLSLQQSTLRFCRMPDGFNCGLAPNCEMLIFLTICLCCLNYILTVAFRWQKFYCTCPSPTADSPTDTCVQTLKKIQSTFRQQFYSISIHKKFTGTSELRIWNVRKAAGQLCVKALIQKSISTFVMVLSLTS